MAAGALLAVALAGYATAATRVRRRWPPARTAAFTAGVVVAAGALALDGRDGFTTHAVQHLLLGMLAPALLALGAPLTLLLQSTRGGPKRRILTVLHSRPVALACSPAVVWALFGGSMLVLYLTPLYRLSVANGAMEELLHVHFLLVGALFFWPVLGADPLPRRLPHGARLLMVFLTIPFHAVLGMALLAAPPLVATYTVADHRAGTSALWAAGDLLGLAAVLVVAFQWMGHEERVAAREDRRGDTGDRRRAGTSPSPR